jgi:hypothetical protein
MGKKDEDQQYLELIKFSPSSQLTYTNIYQKIGKELNLSAFPLVYYIFQSKLNSIKVDIICVILEFLEILTFPIQHRVKYFIYHIIYSILNYGKEENFMRK